MVDVDENKTIGGEKLLCCEVCEKFVFGIIVYIYIYSIILC